MTKQRQPALSKPNLIIPQGNVQVLWVARSRQSYIMEQHGKSENSKQFLYSRVVGFGAGTCCITKFALTIHFFM